MIQVNTYKPDKEKARVYVDIRKALTEKEWRLYREMNTFSPILWLHRNGRLSVGVFERGLYMLVFNQTVFWDLTSELVTREGLRLLRDFAQESLGDFQTVLDGHSLRWSDTHGTRVGRFTPEAEAAYKRIYDRIETLGIGT
jgi:hypothetical protein